MFFSSLIPCNEYRNRKWPTLLYSMRHINFFVTLAFYGFDHVFLLVIFYVPYTYIPLCYVFLGFTADLIVSSCVVLHMISYFSCSIQSKYLNLIFWSSIEFLCFSTHTHTHIHAINWERSHLLIELTMANSKRLVLQCVALCKD